MNLASRYGQWAVVTGASSGIGCEIARLLPAHGINVALVARNASVLESLARELADRGVQTLPLPVDLAAPSGPADVVQAMRQYDVGLLVNAAGFGSGGEFLNAEPRQQSEMVDLNCRSVVELTHAFAQRFAAQRRGGIILFSSIVAFQGVPFAANYSATKAFIQSFGEALADELAPHNVDVLTSAPGPTESGFAARAGMRLKNAAPASLVARETLAALGHRRQVVPGGFAKFLYASLMTVPRSIRVRIMKKVMQSMT